MTKYAVAFFCSLCLANSALAVPMRVQVQSAQVRGTPSFLSQVIATVTYGQTVEALVAQGAWQQVRTTSGSTGWMPTAALTTRRTGTSTGGPNVDTGASADEMTLAGKGFGADVEAQFRAAHAGLDYTWVDKMGRFNVPRPDLLRFVQAGGLKQPGGAK
jgi:SH3-like domain-containing protein